MTTETILRVGQILSFERRAHMSDDEALRFSRAIEQAVLQSPEMQALRKDAERYRWLRYMIEYKDLIIAKVGPWSLESWSGDEPDHYIDAAMEYKK